MGIRLKRTSLQERLEAAVKLADKGSLPDLWIQRTEHIGDSPSKTYVAVLGTAMLAKATDGEVDPLAIKSGSGARAFSARGAVAVLVANARDYGYHLGVTKREPLNNQPWFTADRADTIALGKVKSSARPYLRALVKYLRELDKLDRDEALGALAAFIDVRRKAAATEDEQEGALDTADLPLADLGNALQDFVTEDPEDGKRGEALVAAVFDCLFKKVELGSGVNDPDPFDVKAWRGPRKAPPSPVAQVKQKPADEATAQELSEQAAEAGARSAVLVALAKGQRPINRSSVAEAGDRLGVTTTVIESVRELIDLVAVIGAIDPEGIAAKLPSSFATRLKEVGVRAETLSDWAASVDGLIASA